MRKNKLFLLLALLLTAATGATAQPWTSGDCTVTISEGVMTVSGTGAMADYKDYNQTPWYGNYIETIVIESGVTGIGKYAFASFSNLESVSIPASVTSIGFGAFEDGGSDAEALTVSFAEGSTPLTIGQEAFHYANLKSIDIPNRVTSIGNGAFASCSKLESVSIPASVTSIGNFAFQSCGSYAEALTVSFAEGSTLESIGESTFLEAKLTSINIPNSVTSIGTFAFSGCSNLESVSIPASVTSIGYNAFSSCSKLESVSIPASVTSISEGAFRYCGMLAKVYIYAPSLTTYGANAFTSNATGRKIYVLSDAVDTYKAGWSAYAADIEAMPATTKYTVTLAEGTKDAGNWSIEPKEGLSEGDQVTLQYTGRLKVKGVKATSDAGAPAEEPVTLATPLTMEAQTDGTIEVKISDGSGNSSTLSTGMKYAVNGGEKTTITTTTTINVTKGDKVKFYGNGTSTTDYGNNQFVMLKGTAKTKVYGNIMSLLDETGYETATTLSSEKVFNGLFQANTNLTDASGLLLPAMTLTSGCYNAMFGGCTSLTAAPALPATTLAPTCYYSMFGGCTSLTAAPELPATTLANACYNQMFRSCTSLTTAPVLPATTLANACYYMMFHTCSSLNSVTCLATDISAPSCTNNWLYKVSATGTITTPSATNWTPNSSSGIPSGWTREAATSDEQSAKPAATVTTAPTGAAIVGRLNTTSTALVSGGAAEGGTMMYKVTTENTKPASTDGFSEAVPTAQSITASGKVYVWYYVKGDDTHSDSEIAATAIEVPVADVVWDATNVFNSSHKFDKTDKWDPDPLTYEGITISVSGEEVSTFTAYDHMTQTGLLLCYGDEGDSFTFTAPQGKMFCKIEIIVNEGIFFEDYGDWTSDETGKKFVWSGTAANAVTLGTVYTCATNLNSIGFYLSK